MKRYYVTEVSALLGISTNTLNELKHKLKIPSKIYEEDFKRLKKVVHDIKKHSGGVCTLSTINDFKLYHDLKEY